MPVAISEKDQAIPGVTSGYFGIRMVEITGYDYIRVGIPVDIRNQDIIGGGKLCLIRQPWQIDRLPGSSAPAK